MTAVAIVQRLGIGVPAWLQVSVWNNSVLNYVFAVVIFLGLMFLLRLFKGIAVGRLRAISLRTRNDVDDLVMDMIDKLGWPFYVLVGLLTALTYLVLPGWLDVILKTAWLLVGGFYIIRVALTFVDYILSKATAKAKDAEGVDEAIVGLLGRLIKGSVWIIAFFVLLANYGVNISGLLAGAGIVGLAVAFSLQQVLGDIFASFSIFLDKPFSVGDFIIIGTDMGTVQHIGIRSTRILTLQGQELIVSNRELTTVRVNNYKKLERRRVVFSIGVTYDTPATKLKKIPGIIKKIIDDADNVDFDRAHFKEFAASSLNFEVVFFVKQGDYYVYMNALQEINLNMLTTFKKEKIEFAFPTQTIHVEK